MFRKRGEAAADLLNFPAALKSYLNFYVLQKCLAQMTPVTLVYLLHPEIWFGCVALC